MTAPTLFWLTIVRDHEGAWQPRGLIQATSIEINLLPHNDQERIEVFFTDEREIVVLRHGVEYPDGGEAVYSEQAAP